MSPEQMRRTFERIKKADGPYLEIGYVDELIAVLAAMVEDQYSDKQQTEPAPKPKTRGEEVAKRIIEPCSGNMIAVAEYSIQPHGLTRVDQLSSTSNAGECSAWLRKQVAAAIDAEIAAAVKAERERIDMTLWLMKADAKGYIDLERVRAIIRNGAAIQGEDGAAGQDIRNRE